MLAARSRIAFKTTLRVAGFITLTFVLAGVSLGQIKSGVIVGTVKGSSFLKVNTPIARLEATSFSIG